MPDWNRLIKKHLEREAPLGPNRENIIRELAAHLEESYDQARSRGVGEATALKISLQEVGDWYVLAKEIRRSQSKEDMMNHRTKSLWIPALASITSASLAMTILQLVGVRPQLVWTSRVALSFYWPWLGMLPFCGALGSYMSRRAGGSFRARFVSALAPVLWILLSCVTEPIEIAIHGFGHLVYFAYGFTNWIVIPGLCLLLGAAPFFRGREIKPAKAEA